MDEKRQSTTRVTGLQPPWFVRHPLAPVRRFRCRAAVGAILSGLALPSPALGHGTPVQASLTPSSHSRLCLYEVLKTDLPIDFTPMGLTVTEDIDPHPGITLWSRSSVLVLGLSPREPAIWFAAQADLPSLDPLTVTLTEWSNQNPVVELFDAQGEAIRTFDLVTALSSRRTAPLGAASASGAIRRSSGWIHAHRITPVADGPPPIVIVRPGDSSWLAHADYSTVPSSELRTAKNTLHIRTGPSAGYLVKEAAPPFATVAFTPTGDQLWRTYPDPSKLTQLLHESDLAYIVATPAITLDGAVLNTYVALRSGRRVSALRLSRATSPRYREIPYNLSFLAVLPKHRLLIGHRSSAPYAVLLFSWRWASPRQQCSQP